MSDRTYACSLDAAALAERRADWRALDTWLLDDPGPATRQYARRPEVVAALRRLVAAEAECCPFLHFTITEEADQVRLDVETDATSPAAPAL